MPKQLTDAQVASFRDLGYAYPIPVLSVEGAGTLLAEIDDFHARTGKHVRDLRGKVHLLIKSLYELARSAPVLDAVEDLIGPNILCIESGFFWKPPHDQGFVAWHQDNTYLDLQPAGLAVGTWIALTDSKRDNGGLQVIPGRHDRTLPYDMIPEENHMLKFSRKIRGVDPSKAICMELEPGQMSIHGNGVVHGSEPNRSDRRRVGFACIFLAPHVHPAKGGRMSASLMRGQDTHGLYDLDPVPTRDFDPTAVAMVERALSGSLALYKTTS